MGHSKKEYKKVICCDCGIQGVIPNDWGFLLNPPRSICPVCSEKRLKIVDKKHRRKHRDLRIAQLRGHKLN